MRSRALHATTRLVHRAYYRRPYRRALHVAALVLHRTAARLPYRPEEE